MDFLEKLIKFHDVTVVDKDQLDCFVQQLDDLLDEGFFFTLRVTAYSKNITLKTQHQHPETPHPQTSSPDATTSTDEGDGPEPKTKISRAEEFSV